MVQKIGCKKQRSGLKKNKMSYFIYAIVYFGIGTQAIVAQKPFVQFETINICKEYYQERSVKFIKEVRTLYPNATGFTITCATEQEMLNMGFKMIKQSIQENIMLAIIALFGGLFYYENLEFFDTSREQRSQGYEWEYVGRNNTSGVPALPIIFEKTNEEIIYYKLKNQSNL